MDTATLHLGRSTTLRVPAETGSLAGVRSFCRGALGSCCRDPRFHRRLVLAIDEAMANVIEHAYVRASGGEPSTIDLSLDFEGDRVVVRILDRGIPFDPSGSEASEGTGVARADDPPEMDLYPGVRRSTSHFPRHGFGLRIIRVIMDEIDYRRTPGGENILTLVKRLPGPDERLPEGEGPSTKGDHP